MRLSAARLSVLQVVIVLLTLVPGLISNIFPRSESMKEGLFVASVLCATIGLVSGKKINFQDFNRTFITLFFIITLVLIHGFIMMNNPGFEQNRFYSSLAFLIALFVIWVPITNLFIAGSDADLTRGIWACHWLMLGDAIQAVLQQIQGGLRQMWFASEPSHYALNHLPFIYFITVRSGKIRYLLVSYLVAVGLQNLTLFVGVIIISALTIQRNRLVVLAFIAILLFTTFLSRGFGAYLMDRNILDLETQNLSALVYLSGFERALNTLTDGNWFGVGFQQMGFLGSSGEMMETIRRLESDLNLFDGGTLGAKIILEFGVIALIALCAYTAYFLKVQRIVDNSQTESKDLFFRGVYLTFFCYIFVRGAGYMSINVFYFGLAIFFLTSRRSLTNRVARIGDISNP